MHAAQDAVDGSCCIETCDMANLVIVLSDCSTQQSQSEDDYTSNQLPVEHASAAQVNADACMVYTVYYCVVLCITVCYCVSMCVPVCYCVSLCIPVYYCVLLCITATYVWLPEGLAPPEG